MIYIVPYFELADDIYSVPVFCTDPYFYELGNVNMPQDEESETNPETSDLDLTIAVRKGEKEPVPMFFFLLFVECSKRAVIFDSTVTQASLRHTGSSG